MNNAANTTATITLAKDGLTAILHRLGDHAILDRGDGLGPVGMPAASGEAIMHNMIAGGWRITD